MHWTRDLLLISAVSGFLGLDKGIPHDSGVKPCSELLCSCLFNSFGTYAVTEFLVYGGNYDLLGESWVLFALTWFILFV